MEILQICLRAYGMNRGVAEYVQNVSKLLDPRSMMYN